MTKLLWHEEARAEADAAADYYQGRQTGLEQQFLDSLEDGLGRVRHNPSIYRKIAGNIRKCRLSRFPYAIVYRVRPTHIEIIAIMHLRKSPGYCKNRNQS